MDAPRDIGRERLIRRVLLLSWLSLAYLTIEGGVALFAGIVANSPALVGFAIDSIIEGLASVIIVWRFTGARAYSDAAERKAQKLVAIQFFILAPYVAYESVSALVRREAPHESLLGIVLAVASLVIMYVLAASLQYRWRSGHAAENGGPFSDRSMTMGRDAKDQDYRFSNVWPGDSLFKAEPGVDWMHFGNWVTNTNMASCPDDHIRLTRMVEGDPKVELTLEVSSPRIASKRGTQKLPAKTRRATIGTVTCPVYGECAVSVPKTVKVRIGGKKGKTYTLSVNAPKRLVSGAAARKRNVTVTFPKAAAAALKGTRVRVSVRVTVNNYGRLKTIRSVARTVRN